MMRWLLDVCAQDVKIPDDCGPDLCSPFVTNILVMSWTQACGAQTSRAQSSIHQDVFRFVEGIWLHRKSLQIRYFLKKTYFFICAQHLLSYRLI